MNTPISKGQPILKVEDLSIGFEGPDGLIPITEGVSFEIYPGEMFGLVGESGCGKSVTCLSLLKLLPSPGGRVISGRICYKGREILSLSPQELRTLRGCEMSMIFQEPGAALNPLMTVERQMFECFQFHRYPGNPQQRSRDLLARTGIADPDRVLKAYPHQLSGGMLQRVMIGMALLLNPGFLIADEPTTALDVTVQAQIMELIRELQDEFQTAILLITHNLNLIAQYADRLAVMYAGRIVEQAPVPSFLENPRHPYSQGLLGALPRLEAHRNQPRPIPGHVPRPRDFAAGCRFADRCPEVMDKCSRKPEFYPIGEKHSAACFLYETHSAAGKTSGTLQP